jgi:hypothetical protein
VNEHTEAMIRAADAARAALGEGELVLVARMGGSVEVISNCGSTLPTARLLAEALDTLIDPESEPTKHDYGTS